MAIQTTGNGQVVREKKEASPVDQMAGILAKMAPEMQKALPKHISPERMMRIATTALRTTPDLAQCSRASFLGAVLSAAQLGLEPNTPLAQAYLIPYRNQGVLECQLQIGYQGMLDLARRSGEVASIYAEVVYEGDEFEWTLGLERSLRHVPSRDLGREEQPVSHVYAVAKLRSGDAVFVVLTRAQVEKYRKRGRGKQPAWSTDWEAMARKTAIRRLFTWIPRSAEMARAQVIDEAPELGRVQVIDFDPSVTAALEAHGVEVVPTHDPETGEAPDILRMREPGEDDE